MWTLCWFPWLVLNFPKHIHADLWHAQHSIHVSMLGVTSLSHKPKALSCINVFVFSSYTSLTHQIPLFNGIS